MSIEPALRTYLFGDAVIHGLVGNRIYPITLRQASPMPALTYMAITGGAVVSTDGPTGLEDMTIQIDAWAKSMPVAVQVAEAVQARINGFKGIMGGVSVRGVFLDRRRDLYDNEPELYRRSVDYVFQFIR